MPLSDMKRMAGILQNQEKRYQYRINGWRSGQADIEILRLQAYAYDFYFFTKENAIPLDYFQDELFKSNPLPPYTPDPIFPASACHQAGVVFDSPNYDHSAVLYWLYWQKIFPLNPDDKIAGKPSRPSRPLLLLPARSC